MFQLQALHIYNGKLHQNTLQLHLYYYFHQQEVYIPLPVVLSACRYFPWYGASPASMHAYPPVHEVNAQMVLLMYLTS